jgi:hypothetical protein
MKISGATAGGGAIFCLRVWGLIGGRGYWAPGCRACLAREILIAGDARMGWGRRAGTATDGRSGKRQRCGATAGLGAAVGTASSAVAGGRIRPSRYGKRPRQLRKCERGLLDPFSGNPRSCPQGHVPRVEDAPSGNREYDTFFGGGVDTMSTLRSFTEGVGLGIAGIPTASAGGG